MAFGFGGFAVPIGLGILFDDCVLFESGCPVCFLADRMFCVLPFASVGSNVHAVVAVSLPLACTLTCCATLRSLRTAKWAKNDSLEEDS